MSKQTVYVQVKTLPQALQNALKAHGYGRADIAVDAAETFTAFVAGGQGQKGFCTLVNLATGETETHWGSWGGSNMFSPGNAVDNDQRDSALPPNFAVIKGSEGNSTYATITVNPSSLAPLLPVAAEGISDTDKKILVCYKSLKSGQYRNEALLKVFSDAPSWKPADPKHSAALASALDSLVSRGLLKRSSNGATQITTEGKNAIVGFTYHP